MLVNTIPHGMPTQVFGGLLEMQTHTRNQTCTHAHTINQSNQQRIHTQHPHPLLLHPALTNTQSSCSQCLSFGKIHIIYALSQFPRFAQRHITVKGPCLQRRHSNLQKCLDVILVSTLYQQSLGPTTCERIISLCCARTPNPIGVLFGRYRGPASVAQLMPLAEALPRGVCSVSA